MENGKTWILIADSTEAKFYAFYKMRVFQNPDSLNHLEIIAEFTHDESRKKAHELMTDKLGEFGAGTFVESTSPKVHEAESFALQLMRYVDSARKSNHFCELILIAPPPFMGLLKKHMSHEVEKMLSQTIEKDYVHQHPKDLINNLIQYF